MPKLWSETIEAHRREVRDAVLDATAALVAEHGLLSVTMSEIAARTGIGRATLYKYFPDVESILRAWHERQVEAHLTRLYEVSDDAESAIGKLEAVLEAYAHLSRGSHRPHDPELVAFLHRDPKVAGAERRVRTMVQNLIEEAARLGEVREDVPAGELAAYCLHGLGAATRLWSKAAIARLVGLVLDGLRRG
ncbi:MAG TPA: TetR/AcrR family transcriptional regulator [Actinomycetota bacterium]|nr:TetR/AcrR family transcriptional regulator [Actinomycetota bacterium]